MCAIKLIRFVIDKREGTRATQASPPFPTPPPPLQIMRPSFLPGSGNSHSLFDATLASFGIYSRFVARLLVLACVLRVAAQTLVGFGVQYLFQCCYSAAVLWEALQSE